MTITEHRPPHVLGFTGDSAGVVVKGRFVFEPVGDVTRVIQHMHFWGRGLMVMLAPLIARQNQDEMHANLERLRVILSTRTPVGQSQST